MIHTELDLPAQTYRDIERIAKEKQQPTTQVLREFIDMGVQRWRVREAKPEERGLRHLAKLNIRGPKDLASRLDDYLYGDA